MRPPAYDWSFERLLLPLITLLALSLAFMWVGEMDFQDARAQDIHTCEMVRDGKWPSYQARKLPCDELLGGDDA